VINYYICVIIGYLQYGNQLWEPEILNAPWWPYVTLIGIIFIIGFNIVAICVQFYGMTFTTLMQKMSLVVTAIFGILVYNESSGLFKWTGILAAIPAIYLLNQNPKKGIVLPKMKKMPFYVLALPFMVLIVNSIIDSTFLSMEAENLYRGSDLRLVSYIFFIAAVLGTIVLIVRLLRSRAQLSSRELKAGTLLGLVNYGSIYFILRALNTGWEGSAFYPIINVGIIGCTAIFGKVFFNESLSSKKWAGFALAMISIGLISYIK
jgi:drug/metabolite transporter (DMT)-like permease